MARLHISGNRGHFVAEALTEPYRQQHHYQILVPAKSMGNNILLWLYMDECVLVHLAAPGCRPGQNPSEFSRKDILWLQWTLDWGCSRVVFEPKFLFAFSVFKFLVILTLEKNISKSKVYPPGCTQKKQGSRSFAKLSPNMKLLETVYRGRKRNKIQNEQHFSGYV